MFRGIGLSVGCVFVFLFESVILCCCENAFVLAFVFVCVCRVGG